MGFFKSKLEGRMKLSNFPSDIQSSEFKIYNIQTTKKKVQDV